MSKVSTPATTPEELLRKDKIYKQRNHKFDENFSFWEFFILANNFRFVLKFYYWLREIFLQTDLFAWCNPLIDRSSAIWSYFLKRTLSKQKISSTTPTRLSSAKIPIRPTSCKLYVPNRHVRWEKRLLESPKSEKPPSKNRLKVKFLFFTRSHPSKVHRYPCWFVLVGLSFNKGINLRFIRTKTEIKRQIAKLYKTPS